MSKQLKELTLQFGWLFKAYFNNTLKCTPYQVNSILMIKLYLHGFYLHDSKLITVNKRKLHDINVFIIMSFKSFYASLNLICSLLYLPSQNDMSCQYKNRLIMYIYHVYCMQNLLTKDNHSIQNS